MTSAEPNRQVFNHFSFLESRQNSKGERQSRAQASSRSAAPPRTAPPRGCQTVASPASPQARKPASENRSEQGQVRGLAFEGQRTGLRRARARAHDAGEHAADRAARGRPREKQPGLHGRSSPGCVRGGHWRQRQRNQGTWPVEVAWPGCKKHYSVTHLSAFPDLSVFDPVLAP